MRIMSLLSRLRGRFGIAFVAGVVAGLTAPALAGNFYSWTTEDGVRAYTDDAKRIPARYRSQAQLRDTGTLEGYERFTPVESSAAAAEAAPAARRVEALPSVSAAPPSAAAVRIETGSVEIAVQPEEGGAPIVVEQVRARPDGSDATRTVQVVRQGDRVIAIVKPTPNESSPDGVQESDLLE